ncbi:MAG: serine/threonine protein kinase, partial [Candidatus Parabeggiatoa sp. nov. 1]
ATAYGAAVNYLTLGQECLTEKSWDRSYDLTLNLFTEAAEAAYINGDFEYSLRLINTVLQQAQEVLDKVKVYEVKIQVHSAYNQLPASIETGLEILQQLDIPLLKSPPPNLMIEKLENLPTSTDARQQAAMRILMLLLPAAFITNPSFLLPMGFTLVNLCINNGNSPLAAFAYVFYAMLLCGPLSDIELGYQFGKLSLRIQDKFNAISLKCKVENLFYTFVMAWKEPMKRTLKPLRETVQVGIEIGDIECVCYTVLNYSSNIFLSGQSLEQVNAQQAQCSDLIHKLKQEFHLYYALIWQQLVLNLMGKTSEADELFHEEKLLSFLHQTNNLSSLFCFYFAKSLQSYLFKDYATALENALQATQYEQAMTGMLSIPAHKFYESLAYLARYPNVSTTKTQYLTKVADNQHQMEIWANHAPLNFQHKYDLVEAEKARVLGQNWEAAELYEKAIAGAKENEYLHEEALAYELAAEFYLGRGMKQFAQTYLKEAHYRYQQWGALAKVRDLETRYPQFLAPKTASAIPTTYATLSGTRMASSSTKGGSDWFDFNSLMKAAQTLSGEIVLGQLLEKMMHIVIENAGAETGFLLLPQHDNWFIEAQGHTDSDEINVLQSLSIDNQPIAETIIHYVERSQEHVVLNHATQEGQFTRDPHILKQRPKSVLCAPLINQGKLSGLLYLENNLTTGAFTPDRLEVLKVLSSQLAISIENALLYRTLEQKVEERTAQLAGRTEQLAQANQEITAANQQITALNEQLESENIRMSAELDISRHLQQMLLPKDEELEAINGLDIAGFMEPADEVGGDYYDVLYQDGRVLIGIGDVTGHGLESGALAIMVQSSIRTLLASYQELDSVKFLSALNQMIYHNVIRMNAEKSLTLALLSYQDGQLLLTGQHEEMIVVRKGEVELIDTIDLGFQIGLEPDISDFVAQTKVSLNPGDVVVLYTDGITEAINTEKEEYRIERLCEVVKHNWQQTAQEIREAVIDNVRQFIGQQKIYDDITLLVIKQKY